jgi:hypothetical protein
MFSTIEREARALIALPVVLLAVGLWSVARAMFVSAAWLADINMDEESDSE